MFNNILNWFLTVYVKTGIIMNIYNLYVYSICTMYVPKGIVGVTVTAVTLVQLWRSCIVSMKGIWQIAIKLYTHILIRLVF
jgi:hypothetical protein